MAEAVSGRGRATAGQPHRYRILVVDDAEGIRAYLTSLLQLKGYEVDTAADGRNALALLEAGVSPDVILLDVMMPEFDGLETLRLIREKDPETPVVMLSVVGRASTIVEAMQLGASDYLNKPFEEEELEATLTKVLEKRALLDDREQLLWEVDRDSSLVWEGESMRRIAAVLDHVADTDVTVLIQGESGVGKEIVARAIHDRSSRREKRFVKVNCAALPESLLESELFGYEKGAFTGAVSRKPGKFELAHRGTIFLDEIGEMSPGLQAKLLQVLQDSEFTRLGGNREVRVDVRVICATHRSLEQMVEDGSFRDDLFYRLNVVSIEVPPLRERREEFPRLVDTFMRRAAARYGKPVRPLSEAVVQAMQRYAFPGNVRELENLVKRVVVLESESPVLAELLEGQREEREGGRLGELLTEVEETAGKVPLGEVGRRVAHEVERQTIEAVLRRTGWNRKRAARILRVSYKTLLQKIRECRIQAP